MRISIIVFIVINLVLMSMPYWTARPINKKIRAGEIGNKRIEDSLRFWRSSGKEFQHIVCSKSTRGLKVDINLSMTNEIQMDTTALNFITIDIRNDTLYVYCDDYKYKEWFKTNQNISNEVSESVSVAPVDVPEGTTADGAENIEVGYEIKISMSQLKSLQTKKVNVNVAMFPGDVIQNDFKLIADDADVELRYNEEVEDSLGGYKALVYRYEKDFSVCKKNGSDVKWYNFLPTHLTLELQNDYFSFDSYQEEVEYRPKVILNDRSDLGVNLSMLNKIQIQRR